MPLNRVASAGRVAIVFDMAATMRMVTLPSGDTVPQLGQGTWHMAEDPRRRDSEVTALRVGIDLGMTLIDTAEMYADGRAEELVAAAIEGRRDEVFLVSKVLPDHATREGTRIACENSLRRLRTDRIDLYLLHWRGSVPLADTVEAMTELVGAGKIRRWGVSNFDVDDMEHLWLSRGEAAQTDQVLYNLRSRGIEYDLLPWCRSRSMPIMAYSPIEQGRLIGDPTLEKIAARHDASNAQVALAWVLRHPDVIAIPKAGTEAHVRNDFAALKIELSPHDLAALDREFPPPTTKVPLEML
ncbi:MAG: oxidoreductase [Labilithrix sp.]|nr:oxidoreductase [Labilithrix sp.]